MTTRIGPFGLRVPENIRSWLNNAALENNRSVTSETVYLLTKSLEKEFTKDGVNRFKQDFPTSINTDGFGVRLPQDLKEILQWHASLNKNSLNQEIVMRLADSMAAATPENAIAMDKPSYRKDPEQPRLTTIELELLDAYRKLDGSQKAAVLKLVKSF